MKHKRSATTLISPHFFGKLPQKLLGCLLALVDTSAARPIQDTQHHNSPSENTTSSTDILALALITSVGTFAAAVLVAMAYECIKTCIAAQRKEPSSHVTDIVHSQADAVDFLMQQGISRQTARHLTGIHMPNDQAFKAALINEGLPEQRAQDLTEIRMITHEWVEAMKRDIAKDEEALNEMKQTPPTHYYPQQ